jgi:hypothetical protein
MSDALAKSFWMERLRAVPTATGSGRASVHDAVAAEAGMVAPGEEIGPVIAAARALLGAEQGVA